MGESAERQVELLNAGRADLIAVNIELRDRSTAGEYQLFLEQGGERRPVPERLVLAPDQRALLVVIYSTGDESPAPDRGSVTFATNDPQSLDVELPILAGESGGEIDVSPRTLDFGAVEAGETGVESIAVQNIGRLPLTISGVSVNGPADFSARLGERLLTAGGAFEPIVIAPGERITIDVTYAPPTAGPDQGQLIITSDDPERPTENVNLVANGAAACLRVVPDAVEFGAALLVASRDVETPNTRLLSVESCGSTRCGWSASSSRAATRSTWRSRSWWRTASPSSRCRPRPRARPFRASPSPSASGRRGRTRTAARSSSTATPRTAPPGSSSSVAASTTPAPSRT
ncbi:MAG: choice-of-anchor D domain-containing protein [bacterium]